MLTVSEAFEKFKSRLEISPTEAADASRRQQKIRSQIRDQLAVDRDFLTGSYARHTKTKPLKDVDVFVVLTASEAGYMDQPPDDVLDRVVEILSPHYPGKTAKGNRSVKVDFGVSGATDDQVVSFDVVPAFAHDGAYKIPDRREGDWINTNPTVHAEKATASNAAFDKRWKPVVKMVKKWNDHHDKPVKPSFLLEVMALELLAAPWGGSYPRELRQFFASAADRIEDEWPDPAGLGPAVSARLAEDAWQRDQARRALSAAEVACTAALRLEQTGRTGAALDAWQALFGPRFAKS
ncbi:MAG: CBASS oligonucleotide cyclase [Solirubrobacteraceae bacterium]